MFNHRVRVVEFQPNSVQLIRCRQGRWSHWELTVRQGVARVLLAGGRSATYQRAIVLREIMNSYDDLALRAFVASVLFRRCLSIEKI